ncbi:hypothetical protein GDO86_010373 [Hymenochirus boettgeri]|uniref:Chemokine interleukin-8-like domain-containing protein n=1 Tax=Hymenochirus boettgeri TaxID=247094 RepID=A0A8T2JSR7_9PIPI|nr:hypothetical protein GDO86_010373 [Hymenochirus boettgeri]
MDLPCVDAVMFITDQGKILCARPNIHWVKMKIKEIESKRAESDKAN